MIHTSQYQPWCRSRKGWIAGVCQTLAERLSLNVGLVRLLWVSSILFLGFGFFFYLVCAFLLPQEGSYQRSLKPMALGVCLKISERFDLDLGLLRILTVVIGVGSLGLTLIGYIIIHFLLSPQLSR